MDSNFPRQRSRQGEPERFKLVVYVGVAATLGIGVSGPQAK